MFKKYLRKKQYKKIRSYIEAKIDLTQMLADDPEKDDTTKERYIAQEVILKEVLRFIEREETRL